MTNSIEEFEKRLKEKFNDDDIVRDLVERRREMENFNPEVEEKIYDEMPKYVNEEDFSRFRGADMEKEMLLKTKFNEMGMFGFVSWRWLKPFAKWIGDRKCLEVMAGRGWLSYGLRELGIDVIATDNFSWHEGLYASWNDTKTEVEKLDAVESVDKYGADIDILIMSWAYMDNTAYQVIKRLHEINPDALVVFIGEGGGGCTADDDFYKHFELVKDKKFRKKVVENYQRWHAIHDKPMLGRYVEKPMWEDDEE